MSSPFPEEIDHHPHLLRTIRPAWAHDPGSSIEGGGRCLVIWQDIDEPPRGDILANKPIREEGGPATAEYDRSKAQRRRNDGLAGYRHGKRLIPSFPGARPEALSAHGLTIADSPRAAAADAEFVTSMVRDDDASRQVWLDQDDGALHALGDDAVAIERSTLSVPYVRELTEALRAKGRTLVDAPLAGSRPQAEAGQLVFSIGGAENVFERVRAVLKPLAGAVHHAGESGAGATVKLMVKALFGAQLGVMAALIGFAEKAGIDPNTAVEIIGTTPVCSPAAKMSAGAMLAGAFAPAFPIELVAKDFTLLDRSARQYSAAVPLSLRTGEIYTKGASDGIGDDNITGIVKLNQEGSDRLRRMAASICPQRPGCSSLRRSRS